MKKSLAILVAAAVLGICLFFFFKEEEKGYQDTARFLPEDVLVYYHQTKLGTSLEDFKKTRLGKALAGIDIIQTAKELELPEADISMIEKVQNEGAAFLNGPIFKEVFGNDYTLAIFPPDSSSKEDPAMKIRQNLLVISKPEHGARLMDILTSGFGKVLNQTTEAYDTYTIRHLRPQEGLTLFIAAVGDKVFLSFDDRLIKDCLDRYTLKKRSLADNGNFKKLLPEFRQPVLFAYLGLDLLKSTVSNFLESANPERKDILKKEMQKWNGMQAAGYGIWHDKDKIRDKGIVVIDNQKFDPTIKDIYSTASEKNSSLAIVPEHVLGYYWTNTMNFQAYWKAYLDGATNADVQKMAEFREAVKKRFGMEIEDVLGLLDRQCGFILQNGDASRFLPLPDFSFFVHLKDKARFERFSQNLFQNSTLSIKKQTYKGIEITSMTNPSQGGLVQLYIMHTDYLVAATSLAMMKQIIDVMQGGVGLKDNPGFKKVDAGLLEDNNSVGYIRVGDLMKTIKGLINWGRALVAIRDQEYSRRLGIVMDRLLNPLFDGLSMYSDFGMRSKISPNRITVESTTVFDR